MQRNEKEEMRQRMEEGRLYQPNDEEITQRQFACMEKMYAYNATHAMEQEKTPGPASGNAGRSGGRAAISRPPSTPTGAAAMCISATMCMPTFILPQWMTATSISGIL